VIDEFPRAAAQERFPGDLSGLGIDVKLLENRKRGMLMCREYYTNHVYSNALSETCKDCNKQVELRPNPKIVGHGYLDCRLERKP